MKNSHRFYNNKDCAYLACHDVKNVDEFNCMFCYCPLYFLEDCGGNFENRHGIKDCSKCLIPHGPKGYDYITEKIGEINIQRVEEYLSKNKQSE